MVLMLSSVVGLTHCASYKAHRAFIDPTTLPLSLDHAALIRRRREPRHGSSFPSLTRPPQAPVPSWPPDPPARKHVEAPPTPLGRAQPPEPTIATHGGGGWLGTDQARTLTALQRDLPAQRVRRPDR